MHLPHHLVRGQANAANTICCQTPRRRSISPWAPMSSMSHLWSHTWRGTSMLLCVKELCASENHGTQKGDIATSVVVSTVEAMKMPPKRPVSTNSPLQMAHEV
jgi:hypothetical protein